MKTPDTEFNLNLFEFKMLDYKNLASMHSYDPLSGKNIQNLTCEETLHISLQTRTQIGTLL